MNPVTRRRRRLGLAVVIGMVAVMLGSITATFAFHVGDVGVEMDGNTDPSAGPSVDWEDLITNTDPDGDGPLPTGWYVTGSVDAAVGSMLDGSFVQDFEIGKSGPDSSYHEPSNKDDQAINAAAGSGVWGCVSAKNPTDKDDILNAYAIAYIGAEGSEDVGDIIVAFGAERFDDSGTAYIGFWLFQDDVECDLATNKFTGTKTDGDILMLVNFSNGGSNVTVNAFSWHPGTPAATAAGTFSPIGVGVRCDLTSDSGEGGTEVDMCAITNGPNPPTIPSAQNVTVPWPTEDKDKPGPGDPVNTLEPPEFVEGAINLTDAFEKLEQEPPACFGSFMTETRSSDTLSATLKDFALGDFDTCDATVSISPTATNRVGTEHTFTVTASQLSNGVTSPATVGHVDVTLTGDNGIEDEDIVIDADASTCDDADDNLGDDGTCVLVVNSEQTGTITASATVTIDIDGTEVVRTTDGVDGNSEPAVKTYVDATIDITGDGTNEVGLDHRFTAHVQVDSGDGDGFQDASGIDVTIHKTDTDAASDPAGDQTCITGSDGTCYVEFTSPDTGTTTGTAEANIDFGDLDFNIFTSSDATSTEAEDVLKAWVDAYITIDDDSTNRVGAEHTFTVTVYEDVGDGNGFVPAAGETVTPSEEGTGSVTGGTCTTGTTGLDGTCTVIVDSDTAGSTEVTASSTVSVGDTTVSVSTNGTGNNSDGATKTWVDLRIGIAGDDTNGIGEEHTFVVTVEANDGSGWDPVQGAQPVVTLVAAAGAVIDLDTTATTCDLTGHDGAGTDASGECDVVFSSDTAGTVTGSATVTATVGGLAGLTASTGDDTSLTNATVLKTFKSGTLVWHKEDNKGEPLGGASFEVCRTETLDSSTDPDSSVAENPDICFPVTDNDATDENDADGEFLVSGLVLGTYTVRETAAPAGYHIDDEDPVDAGSMTLELAPGDQDLEIVAAFVNSKAYRLIVITCDDISNTLVVSEVDLGGVVLDTIDATQPAGLGWLDDDDSPVSEADLCALPGATFGDLSDGEHNPSVVIPN